MSRAAAPPSAAPAAATAGRPNAAAVAVADEATSPPAVKLVSSQAELDAALRIRFQVFHEEQGFPADTEVDEYDPICAHLVLVDARRNDAAASTATTPGADGKDATGVLGVVRLVPYPLPDAQRPAAVEPDASRTVAYRPTSHGEVALARLFAATRQAKLGRLAVPRASRGRGYGDALLRGAERWLVDVVERHAADPVPSPPPQTLSMCLSSQMHVQDFYVRHGYEGVGEVYIEEGAPHRWFQKRCGAAP